MSAGFEQRRDVVPCHAVFLTICRIVGSDHGAWIHHALSVSNVFNRQRHVVSCYWLARSTRCVGAITTLNARHGTVYRIAPDARPPRSFPDEDAGRSDRSAWGVNFAARRRVQALRTVGRTDAWFKDNRGPVHAMARPKTICYTPGTSIPTLHGLSLSCATHTSR